MLEGIEGFVFFSRFRVNNLYCGPPPEGSRGIPAALAAGNETKHVDKFGDVTRRGAFQRVLMAER